MLWLKYFDADVSVAQKMADKAVSTRFSIWQSILKILKENLPRKFYPAHIKKWHTAKSKSGLLYKNTVYLASFKKQHLR